MRAERPRGTSPQRPPGHCSNREWIEPPEQGSPPLQDFKQEVVGSAKEKKAPAALRKPIRRKGTTRRERRRGTAHRPR